MCVCIFQRLHSSPCSILMFIQEINFGIHVYTEWSLSNCCKGRSFCMTSSSIVPKSNLPCHATLSNKAKQTRNVSLLLIQENFFVFRCFYNMFYFFLMTANVGVMWFSFIFSGRYLLLLIFTFDAVLIHVYIHNCMHHCNTLLFQALVIHDHANPIC